ncbi:MAG: elicitor-associated permease-like protein [Bacillota bacterium]
MNFIKYLSFKYKITRHKPKGSRKELLTDWLVNFLLYMALITTLYLIVNSLPQNIQENMNRYILGLFAFLCLISISTSIKKYYREYFLSLEREILLIIPIKNSQIILSRFFIVALEVVFINSIFLFPFILANYFAGNVTLEIVLITIPQIVGSSIFFSVITHILFAFAYIISKGKGLKTVAYSIMTFASVGVISIIVYFHDYKSFLLIQNNFFKSVLYLVFQYPKYLLDNQINLIDVGLFTVFISINIICLIPIAYWITDFCYKRGFLTVSSRDLEKSFYSIKVSAFFHKYIKNYFLRKDLLYLIRSPKLFSVYVSPILFTSVIEFRNQFASSGVTLPILINVFTLIITGVTLHILLSDDIEHQNLLFSIPFDIEKLFKMRSTLLHILSFLISGSYILTLCILESVKIEVIIYSIGQLFILTYISSKVILSKVLKRSNKDSRGYRYNGEIVKSIIYYIFAWNIPLLIFFSILNVYLIQILENRVLSLQANIILILILAIVIGMFYKSTKTKINHKENRLWT